MSNRAVVVIGGGIGGVVAARRLRRLLAPDDRVVLIERQPILSFAPSLLWVMAGTRRPAQIRRDLRRLRRRGIEVLEATVEAIEPATRTVRTTAGDVGYDRLVVALGAELAPDLLPGFSDAAHDIYTVDGAESAGTALRELDEGRVVIAVASLPYKCPAAPWEAAFLTDTLLRSHGVRDGCTVDVYTPEPQPMPVAGPEIGRALTELLEERDIGVHTGSVVEAVQPSALALADGVSAPFDVLLGVPPHRPPEPIRDDALGGGSGFLSVDPTTLATSADGVSAIGDVTAISIAGDKMLPKAGVFAEREAEVVAHRIAAELQGRVPAAEFDGHGSCFVELGNGVAAYATGNFFGETGPEVRMRRPGRRWHITKVAIEQYWLRRWAA
jgi:sulfide:quinone oxidoreductase